MKPCTFVIGVYQGVKSLCGQPGKATGEQKNHMDHSAIRCADHWPKVVS